MTLLFVAACAVALFIGGVISGVENSKLKRERNMLKSTRDYWMKLRKDAESELIALRAKIVDFRKARELWMNMARGEFKLRLAAVEDANKLDAELEEKARLLSDRNREVIDAYALVKEARDVAKVLDAKLQREEMSYRYLKADQLFLLAEVQAVYAQRDSILTLLGIDREKKARKNALKEDVDYILKWVQPGDSVKVPGYEDGVLKDEDGTPLHELSTPENVDA